MRRLPAALCLVLAFGFGPARAQEAAPAVLASIKPVHSIVSAIMAGAGAPDILLSGGASPHSYALKPSDARKLSHARVIFWIGPELESFLVTPLANGAAQAKIVALGAAPGVMQLPAREGGLFDGDVHDHEHGPVDPHLWLDPRNGAAMGLAVAAVLAASDPQHAALYRRNAENFAARMRALDAELARTLMPARGRPYIALHDAYHYFEDRYGLTPAGVVTVASDRPVGARRILEVRARIEQARIACVLSPPQFSPRLVAALTEGAAVNKGTLDDLGALLPPGPALYETLLRQMANAFALCLAP